MSWTEGKGEHAVDPSLDEPRGCPTPGARSASAEIARLRAAEAAAFRRGVEAMRTEAMDACRIERESWRGDDYLHVANRFQERIAALPSLKDQAMTTIPALETVIGRLMDKDQASVFALLDIATERLRQITAEGWTPEHDDRHANHELSRAAGCYALHQKGNETPLFWPWDVAWWKPRSPHRNNVRAGALLVAELARHMRSAPS